MSLRVLVIGDGKMGRACGEVARERGCRVVGMYGPTEMARPLSAGIADVAVEFTQPGAAAANVRACIAAHLPVVSGTTGWDAELNVVRIEATAAGAALLHAPNFSLGIQVFKKLVVQLANGSGLWPQASGLSLSETHHAAKLDKPSGTAKMLARLVKDVLGYDPPVTSHRIGEVPGTHELVLDSQFEKITLVHEARDRRVFAEGAVAAAKWLVGRRGVFTFEDYVADRLNQK